MADRNLHIERLRLNLRGVDPATARIAAEGLAEAIAAGLGPGALLSLRGGRIAGLRLNPIVLPPDPSAVAVQKAAGNAVAGALTVGTQPEAQP
jgi:hypothetical protein